MLDRLRVRVARRGRELTPEDLEAREEAKRIKGQMLTNHAADRFGPRGAASETQFKQPR